MKFRKKPVVIEAMQFFVAMLAGVFVLSIYLIVSETVKLAQRMGKERV